MPRFELKGKVGLDGSKWKAGLTQAKREANTWSSETSKMIKSRLASAFAVGALAKSATAILDRAGNIERDASKLDVSPEMFQHLEYAAKQSKVEIDEVREAMLELSVKQQEVAEGSEDVTKAFQRFGLEFDDVVNETPLRLFEQIANSIASGENKENMIANMDTILSDDGKRLIPAFKSDFFGKVSESQNRGATFDNQQVREMAETSRAMTNAQQHGATALGNAFSNLSNSVAQYGHLLALPFDAEARGSLQNAKRLEQELNLKVLRNIEKNTKQTTDNTAPLNQ
jgi:hypothetical protein